MGLVDTGRANTMTVPIRSGGTVTLDASNLFTMTPEDRAFVLQLVATLEAYIDSPICPTLSVKIPV